MPSNDAPYSYGVAYDDAEGPTFGAAAWVAASAAAHAFVSSTESSVDDPSSSGPFVRWLGRWLLPLPFSRNSSGDDDEPPGGVPRLSLVALSATLVPATLFVVVLLSQAKECLRRKFAKAEAEGLLVSGCPPPPSEISNSSDTTNTRDASSAAARSYDSNPPPPVRFRSSTWPTDGASYRDGVVERKREAAKATARTISWSSYLTMAEEEGAPAAGDPPPKSVVEKADDFDEEDPEIEELEENLAPLHLHATRREMFRPRLSGTPNERGHRSRSSSRGSHRSRSSSPAGGGGILPSASSTSVSSAEGPSANEREARRLSGGGSASMLYDGNLSISSIEDVDPDILLDRMGFEELEPPASHPVAGGTLASPGAHLPPVNERLSEETLEDCHAFQDLSVPSGGHSSHPSSRGGSVAGGSRTGEDQGLETLDEEEENSDDDENGDGGKEGKKDPKKKGAKKNTALEHDVLIEMLVDKAGGGVIVEESEEGDKDEAAAAETTSST